MTAPEKITVLIPSLEPDNRLVPYLKALVEKGFSDIVIVDDGSGADYQQVFDEIKAIEGCTVLGYPTNQGKGVALKTGYSYLEKRGNCYGVVTADSDGQHTVEDVWNIAKHIAADEQGLFLGARDFSMNHVPWKSFFGNRITSGVFWALYGQKLIDTQTGLRGFGGSYLPFMQEVLGERFEYEMNVLVACAKEKIQMISIPIETVYENNNEGSHFRAVHDAARIYKVLFGNFFLFMGTSIVSFLIDQGLFHLLRFLLPKAFTLSMLGLNAVATGGARIVSAIFNYVLNRKAVFKDKGEAKKSFIRYIALALGIYAASALGVTLLESIGISTVIGKIAIDFVLYFISYRIQRNWVFAEKQKNV